MISTAPPAQATASSSAFARPASLLSGWHLLSLDAPTVAALWTWFIARCAHVRLPVASAGAMFLAVWILYAADRLLDARRLEDQPLASRGLEVRHLYHFQHRRLFGASILLCSLALIPLLLTIPAEAIRLYLIAGTLLFAWFVLIHAGPGRLQQEPHRLPKELAVGAFFAATTFIPTISREPGLRPELLVPAILFGALCSLNCLFIYAWEHEAEPDEQAYAACHTTTRFGLRHLRALAVFVILADLLIACLVHAPARTTLAPLCLPIALSAALLLGLHGTHKALRRTGLLNRTGLRAAADFILLTPLLILPFVGR